MRSQTYTYMYNCYELQVKIESKLLPFDLCLDSVLVLVSI